MARSTVGSHTAVSSRSVRPRHKSTAKRRHKAKSIVESEAPKPDVNELRRLREAYYSQPSRQRHLVGASIVDARPDQSTSVRSSKSKGKQPAVDAPKQSARAASKQPDRTAEYVYGAPALHDILEDDSDQEQPARSQTSRRRRSHRRSSKTRESSSSSALPDADIMPDDSVSQIGSRSHRPRRRMQTTLWPILEKQEQSAAATKTRQDSILGSIFSRKSTTTPPAKHVECLTCGADDILSTKAPKLACGHRMCHSCLKRIFKLAVQDPAHMPPKCCTDQHIPLKHVDNLFDLKFKVIFNKKYDEYHTRDRVYCPNRRCGIWIRPAYFHTSGQRRYAQCNKCKTRACLMCNQKLHKTSECPKDPEIAKLVEQAEEQGWKRCYSCNAMVELESGCNHMTCRCTAEFCMVCGAKWKTCDCPWFNQTDAGDLAGGPFQDLLNNLLHPLHARDPLAVLAQELLGGAAPVQPRYGARPRPPVRIPGYREEMNNRQRQEQQDEELARRLQGINLDELEPEPVQPRQRPRQPQGWATAVAAGHSSDRAFVQKNGRIPVHAVSGAATGKRGERASTRRKPPRLHQHMDDGLTSNVLGEQNDLGE